MARPLMPLVLLATLAGCGATSSTALLTDADAFLESARNAGAEERAPYELRAAELYAKGAREHIGRAEYDAAVQLATRARDLARAARDRSLGGGRPVDAVAEAPPLPSGPTPEGPVALGPDQKPAGVP